MLIPMLRRPALALTLLFLALPASGRADPLVGQWHLDASNPSCPGACGPSYTTPDSSTTGLDIGPSTTDAIQLTSGGGRWGNALAATNNHVLIHAVPAALQPDDLTLIAWVRHSGYPGTLQYIVGEGDNGATCTASSYALYTGTNSAQGLEFYLDSTSGLAFSPPAGTTLWDGQWHMVAGAFDGSKVRLYIDGTEVGSGTTPPSDIINYVLSGQNFFIDGYPPVGCGSGNFSGDVDEVRVYDRALTATELGRLASPTASTPPVLIPDGTTDVHTTSVGQLSPTSATVLGTIDDHGTPEPYHADYGTSPSYGQVSSSSQTAGSNAGPQAVSVTITGLTPDTDYHAQLVGSTLGGDISFHTPQLTTTTTTLPPPPSPPVITGLTSYGSDKTPGTPAVVSADLSRPAIEIDWTVDNHEVICPGNEPTLMYTPIGELASHRSPRISGSTKLASVTAKAVNSAGSGPTITKQVAYTPPSTTGLSSRQIGLLSNALAQRPTYQCTAQVVPKKGIATRSIIDLVAAEGARCYFATLDAVTLRVKGCFTPVTKAADITSAPERTTLLNLLGSHLGGGGDELIQDADVLIASGPVLVNGVQFNPINGAKIVVSRVLQTLITSNATLSVGGIPLKNPNLDPKSFKIDTSGTGPLDLDWFPRGEGGTVTLGGIGLSGDVRVVIEPGGGPDAYSNVSMSFQLPEFLGGGQADATGRLNIDGNFEVNSVVITKPDIELGFGSVKDFRISYANGAWNGTLSVCALGLACLDANPGDGLQPPGGVTVGPGDSFSMYVHLAPAPPGLQLSTDVFLTDVGIGADYPPLRLRGNANVTVGSLLEIDGRAVFAFPTAEHPYTLSLDRETVPSFPEDAYNVPRHDFTLGVNAIVYLTVPLFKTVQLGSGYLLYSGPLVRVGGHLKVLALGVLQLTGDVSADVNFQTGKFNIYGKMDACIADIPLFGHACLGSTGDLSDHGAGACTEVGPLSVGGGVNWSGPNTGTHLWVFDGCRWSPFADFDVGHIAADSPVIVHTKAGDRSREVELDGTTGAPTVHVVAADGKTLDSSAGSGLVYNSGIRILRSEKLKMTVVGFVNPAAGNNTITLLPGSSPVLHSSVATDQLPALLTAAVSGNGSHRVLMYKVRARQAQQVSFYEDVAGSMRQIGTTTRSRGSLKFTATPSTHISTIVARFTLAGLPGERTTIAHFKPPSPKLAKVRQVRVTRHRSSLRVSWSPVAGATRYEVVATLAIGGERIVRVHGLSAAVTRVPRWSAGRVTVRALAPDRSGLRGSGRFRGDRQHPKTALKPLDKPRHH
jgi:hypothetical protein